MFRITQKNARVYGLVGLLVAGTVLYSVVNSARAVSIVGESSETATCLIVQAVCSINADTGFCATAQQRACDAMQPSPFARLVESSTPATFFLALTLLATSILSVFFKPRIVLERKAITFLDTTTSILQGLYKSQLLAGKFSALRF